MSTDFFGDFCLACDQQTNGSTFCSQACRLAELELYTGTESSMRLCNTTSQSTSHRQTASAGSGFQLPPAYNFASHRQSSSTSLSTSSSSLAYTAPQSPKPTSYSNLPDKVRSDLRDYVGAFDQTRTIRRRVSMQSN